MINDELVASHYDRPDLVATIAAAVEAAGLSRQGLTEADLAPIGEFHTGGRPATEHLLAQLELGPGLAVLDVGCGTGGAARCCAAHYGVRVTGIDLTPGYVEAATELTEWVGLSEAVTFRQANGAELPFKKHTFDAAYQLHVGMNVPDKTGLFTSIGSALKPGARFGVYDLMRMATDDPTFPLPWASSTATSFLATPDSYRASLEVAGFEVVHQEDRTGAVLEMMTTIARQISDGSAPPQPLGLHLLMGPEGGTKLVNMVTALEAGIIAPVELVGRRAG